MTPKFFPLPNPDGTMARLDDLAPFARRHHMKIGRICDLVAWLDAPVARAA